MIINAMRNIIIDIRAMSLFKILKEQKIEGAPGNPRSVGQEILNHIPSIILIYLEHELVEKVELAGPGYINLYLSKENISNEVNQILKDGKLTFPTTHKKTVVIDYSSPNIAKDMHVGHLRSTIIGDAMAKILEFCGHEVQ